jgi:hypothetical protein
VPSALKLLTGSIALPNHDGPFGVEKEEQEWPMHLRS